MLWGADARRRERLVSRQLRRGNHQPHGHRGQHAANEAPPQRVQRLRRDSVQRTVRFRVPEAALTSSNCALLKAEEFTFKGKRGTAAADDYIHEDVQCIYCALLLYPFFF